MSRLGLVLCSRLTFDLPFTFVPALITPGRLYYALLMPSKATFQRVACHLVDAAEC